jgi:hypothetical protein
MGGARLSLDTVGINRRGVANEMKESYRKGIANHPDPESCEGSREAALKRWKGAHVGWVSQKCKLRNSKNQMRRRCQANRKAILWSANYRKRHAGAAEP